MKDVFDWKSAERSMKIRQEHPIFDYDEHTNDVKEFIELFKKRSTFEKPKKVFVRALCVYREYFKSVGDTDGLKLVNKIIGDHRILDKLIGTIDGSYMRARIMIDNGLGEHYVECYDMEHRSNADNRKRLNFLKNNYEVIYIDVDTTIKSIKDILKKHALHAMDDMHDDI